MKFLLPLIILVMLGGCGVFGPIFGIDIPSMDQMEINDAIDKHKQASKQVQISDSKKQVLDVLEPTQASLSARFQKSAERYKDPTTQQLMEVYYFRSGLIADRRTTDDEFTPYLFIDDTLAAIGWKAIQGYAAALKPSQSSIPSSSSQTQPSVQILESNATSRMPESQSEKRSGLLTNPSGETFLAPVTPNAYGPGINSDATGRPFTYQPEFGGSGNPDPTLKVTPNAYGPGVGMDQYGRPVRPKSWP